MTAQVPAGYQITDGCQQCVRHPEIFARASDGEGILRYCPFCSGRDALMVKNPHRSVAEDVRLSHALPDQKDRLLAVFVVAVEIVIVLLQSFGHRFVDEWPFSLGDIDLLVELFQRELAAHFILRLFGLADNQLAKSL